MNNKQNPYVLLLLSGFILYGCAGESNQADFSASASETSSAKTEIEFPALEAETPDFTKDQLKAFELRAIQKFKDYLDYLKIITDPEVEPALSEHSTEMMRQLFITETNIFLDSLLLEHPTQKKVIHLSKVKFEQELTKDTNNVFSGVLKAHIRIDQHKMVKKIDVHLVAIEKEFGAGKQTTTAIKMGEIYE